MWIGTISRAVRIWSTATYRWPTHDAEGAIEAESASLGHLGIVAMQLGRKLRWDAETETVVDDPVADRMLGRAMRPPWRI